VATDFVPAAGRAWLTGAYDTLIAVSARVDKLRGGIIASVSAENPVRVLELGSGTGTLSLALAQALPAASITGVDLDPAALEIARAKPGAERVDWQLGSATDAPPKAGTWDCVVISLVLHHLTPAQQPVALSRAYEALRPGGSLHVIDFGPPHGPVPKLGWPLLQRIDGAENTTPLGRGDLPGLIDAAGFSDRTLLQRFGTVWGTKEQYRATRAAG
jgi:ubiquinone/menaquinone biosynthesis C-methylase UbiE